MGMPLYTVFGPHGGYRLLQKRMLPPILFSEQEAVAMFFAFQSLQFYGSLPFEAESLSALNKFYHYLPEDTKARIDVLKDRISFWTPLRPQNSPFLEQILEAALDQHPLWIRYASKEGDTDRMIQPIGIYSQNGFWYLPSYCYKKEKLLLFRADRIIELKTTESKHPGPDLSKYTITNWLNGSHSPYAESQILKLRVRLTRKGVRASEGNMAFADCVELQEDGSGLLKTDMHRDNFPYFSGIFLGLGADAVVEEPQEMVEWIQKQIQELSAAYGMDTFNNG